MSRNFLKGAEGDLNNALLCACGFNMRKLLAVFLLPFSILSQYHMKSRLIYIIIDVVAKLRELINADIRDLQKG
jgi:hypothetical protein